MSTTTTVSFPVRLPVELDQQIQQAADLTGISKQDLMRLALRIGLVDLHAAEHDLPGIVKRIADDKGVSFQAFADAAQNEPSFTSPAAGVSVTTEECANTAPSTSSSRATSSPTAAASIASLPPPPTLGTVVHAGLTSPHSLNEQTSPPPVTAPRRDVTYPAKKRPRKTGTDT
jgi:hypothetical protein